MLNLGQDTRLIYILTRWFDASDQTFGGHLVTPQSALGHLDTQPSALSRPYDQIQPIIGLVAKTKLAAALKLCYLLFMQIYGNFKVFLLG